MTAARDYLLVRLEAPLMAFGGPMTDAIGPTRAFPGQSQITGLLGNALGYDHRDAARLEALQARLRLAVLSARPGTRLRDFHTVDLGQPHLRGTGWTTRGRMEQRAGAAGEATHIRQRWYLADALVVLALTLDPPDAAPALADLADALDRPARPLFIGRKACLPTAPLRLGAILRDVGPRAALREGLRRVVAAEGWIDPDRSEGRSTEIDARLLPDEPDRDAAEALVDRRDWRNQMHTGTRQVCRFPLHPAA